MTEQPSQSFEGLPERFPIIERDSVDQYSENQDVPDNIIRRESRRIDGEGRMLRSTFRLTTVIADLHYEFELRETMQQFHYALNFKTQEYEYATTNGGLQVQQLIGVVVAKLIRSIDEDSRWPIQKIEILTASSDYTPTDIEECRTQIINHPNNHLRPEEIYKIKNAKELFDIYYSLNSREFQTPNSFKKASARARLFKTLIRKALPDWRITSDPFSELEFTLSNPRIKDS